jgi:hypothetical protein
MKKTVAVILAAFIFGYSIATAAPVLGQFFASKLKSPFDLEGLADYKHYCIKLDELREIKSRPADLSCGGSDWVLAARNVIVKDVDIHPQKRLVEKEVCTGIKYYTWKCHPPDWGSLYKNTLWKLVDSDPNRKIKDGDIFDVYIKKDAEEEGYWICEERGKAAKSVLGISTIIDENQIAGLKGIYLKIGDTSAIWMRSDDAKRIDVEDLPPTGLRTRIDSIEVDGIYYDVFINLLKAFVSFENTDFYLVEKGVFDQNGNLLMDEFIYHVFKKIEEKTSDAKTIKLGTFKPPLYKESETAWYYAYLPESKPVIYLYPQEQITLDIKVIPKNGSITYSDPFYNPLTGWQDVTSDSKGQLKYQGMEYPYLYYETEVKGYEIPTEGFIVEKENLKEFFTEKNSFIGLNSQESKDFNEYWVPRIELEVSAPYVFVTYLSQKQQDDVVKLWFSKNPDNIIRIRPYFKPIFIKEFINPQKLQKPPERSGFTVVEWGGILDLKDK